MTTVTLWILISVSNSSYNHGTVTVVARFTSERNCEATRAQMPGQNIAKAFCVKAEGALP